MMQIVAFRRPRMAAALCATVLTAIFARRLPAEQAHENPPPEIDSVAVEIFEGIPDRRSWEFEYPAAAERYHLPALGLVCTPKKYTAQGLLVERSHHFVVSSAATTTFPA